MPHLCNFLLILLRPSMFSFFNPVGVFSILIFRFIYNISVSFFSFVSFSKKNSLLTLYFWCVSFFLSTWESERLKSGCFGLVIFPWIYQYHVLFNILSFYFSSYFSITLHLFYYVRRFFFFFFFDMMDLMEIWCAMHIY